MTRKVKLPTDLLRQRCLAQEEDFFALGEVAEGKDGPNVFIDRGAAVLAVAHLDTVREERFFLRHGQYVLSPSLDDRLGAFIALDYLPMLGVECDVLLTTNEEHGASTAADFEARKKYNWAFAFDRRGADVVTYHYAGGRLALAFAAQGVAVARGSYSDIVDLDHLGVECINVGAGYHDNHQINAYADLAETVRMLKAFLSVYRQLGDTRLPWDKPKPKPFVSPYGHGVYGRGNGYAWQTQTQASSDQWIIIPGNLRPDGRDACVQPHQIERDLWELVLEIASTEGLTEQEAFDLLVDGAVEMPTCQRCLRYFALFEGEEGEIYCADCASTQPQGYDHAQGWWRGV